MWWAGGERALIAGSGGNGGRAFISWGILFFNFSCLAGDIGFGASIGDSDRGITFLWIWWLKLGISSPR
jgi:hypothetical protein